MIASLLKSKIEIHDSKYDIDIKDFLCHLVFAVNQLNEKGNIIEKEIGKKLDFITENIYNKFFMKILNWFVDKDIHKFFFYNEEKKFFNEANAGIFFNVKNPTCTFLLKEWNNYLICIKYYKIKVKMNYNSFALIE